MVLNQNHYVFVDILKGIAILLIVYGHIIPGCIPFLTKYVSTFHIPLFFFVSGLLFNETKYQHNFVGFLRGRTRGLALPFLMFSGIVAIGYYLIEVDYTAFLCNLFRTGWGGYALWFVPVLLLVEIAYYPLAKLHATQRLLVLVICVICSFLSSKCIGHVSHNALLLFCGIWFYGIGNFVRPLLKYSKFMNTPTCCVMIIAGFILSLFYIPICVVLPEWFVNKIPSLVFYLTPLLAIIGMVGLSFLIERCFGKIIVNIFSVCGKLSLIILAFHQIICMIAQQYVPSKVSILTMIICLTFLMWFIPKYSPWMLGKTKT